MSFTMTDFSKMDKKPFLRSLSLGILIVFGVWGGEMSLSHAAQPPRSIIRDAETEAALREWSEGVLQSAGLSQGQVNIILLEDPGINAFVAGGANIFIYTGLLLKTETPTEALGVIAHEMGHISGGHLTRTSEVAENASFEAILGAVLGIGAAIATGDGAAAAAGVQIGQSTAMNSFLSHSRVQESSADQAGFRFMTGAGVNPSGLVSFLDKLSSQELLDTSQQSEYVRTHPLSRDRVEALENQLSRSALRGKELPVSWVEEHARIKAKLLGYISPQQVTYVYKSSDSSIPSLYARGIAAYRMNHVTEALTLADQLIAREPKNPYFHELKGQMLFEFGKIPESVKAYEKAVALLPSSGLIRVALAHSLIEQKGAPPSSLQEAISHLKRAEREEPRSSSIKRLLATAYGRMGKETEARVYLAEEALMQGNKEKARSMAEDALKKLPTASPERVRAQDVINSVGDQDKKH